MKELLKDKLQQWLSSKSMGESDQPGCSLSKKDRGIIHMIAGLGFEWALNQFSAMESVSTSGILMGGLLFIGLRVLEGTKIPVCAFWKGEMVAALLASGAFAGAVTDPTSEDRTG